MSIVHLSRSCREHAPSLFIAGCELAVYPISRADFTHKAARGRSFQTLGKTLSLAQQNTMTTHLADPAVKEIRAGHLAMLSAPIELTRMLDEESGIVTQDVREKAQKVLSPQSILTMSRLENMKASVPFPHQNNGGMGIANVNYLVADGKDKSREHESC